MAADRLMSKASFSINVDAPRDFVSIRMGGFFGVDDVARFEAELMAAHRQLDGEHRGGPLTLNDISGLSIQSQEVVKRWGEFLAHPVHRSRRLAFVVGSTLARMQLQRAIGERDARIFSDMVEAEQWLFSA